MFSQDKSQKMKGLVHFIAEIRKCKTPQDEVKRIQKELDNIKSKCTGSGANKLDAYNRKKYTWKLLLIHMLSYDTGIYDGDLKEVVQMFMKMVASGNYQEKNVGYLACAVFMHGQPDLLRMIIHSAKQDLSSPRDEIRSLSLITVANVGGPEFAEILGPDVVRILSDKDNSTFLLKKSALCLLNLQRVAPETALPADEMGKIVALLRHEHVGVLVSVASLLLGRLRLAAIDGNLDDFQMIVPEAALVLRKLVLERPKNMTRWGYWLTICPWLQIKCMKMLQHFPAPDDAGVHDSLVETVAAIYKGTKVTKNVSKNNADHGVLFQAMSLVIHYSLQGVPQWEDLLDQTVAKLSKFVGVKSSNIRFVAMDLMAQIFRLEGFNDLKEHVRKIVTPQLNDRDTAIRQKVSNLLFAMSDDRNSTQLVADMFKSLVKEESVLADEEAYEKDRERRRRQQKARQTGQAIIDDEPEEKDKGYIMGRDKELVKMSVKLQHSLSGRLDSQDYFDYVLYEKRALARRIAVLCEKYAFDTKKDDESKKWFVDACLAQMATAPQGYVPEDVYNRLLYATTQHDDIAQIAATKALQLLQDKSTGDDGVRVAAYLVYKYHGHIADKVEAAVAALHDKLNPEISSPPTRAIIIEAVKSLGGGDEAEKLIKRHKHVIDPKQLANLEEAVAAQSDVKDDSEDEPNATYLGHKIAYFFAQYALYDHNSQSVRKIQNTPKSQPADEAVDDTPPDDIKTDEEEFKDFLGFVDTLKGLTADNFKDTWLKIRHVAHGLPHPAKHSDVDDVLGLGSSDHNPNIYELPTGEEIEVDPAQQKRIINTDALTQDDKGMDDVWDEMAAAAKGTGDDNWVSFDA